MTGIFIGLAICMAFIFGGAIGYRCGRLDGFCEGQPKIGEVPALRAHVKNLQAALEAQTRD